MQGTTQPKTVTVRLQFNSEYPFETISSTQFQDRKVLHKTQEHVMWDVANGQISAVPVFNTKMETKWPMTTSA